MSSENYTKIYTMCSSVARWQWVIGNHDKNISHHALFQDFHCLNEVVTENLILRHEPVSSTIPQIIGHYHPKTTVYKHNIRITGRCFIFSKELFIMPSFGTYTGGLDVESDVIQELFNLKKYECYLLRKENVWHI